MNTLIISSIKGAVGANKLFNSFREHGHGCHIASSDSNEALPFAPDVIIPRVSPKSITKTTVKLHTLNTEYPNAIFTATESQLDISFSKLSTYREFVKNGVATPKTWYSIDKIGPDIELPVIVKPINGNRGIGIRLVHTREKLLKVLVSGDYVAQEFITESRGTDVRVFVLGDEVVASMIRRAPEGEVVANIAQGAKAEPIVLDADTRQLAINACRSIGLKIGGVDLIKSNRGMLVLEVNPSPGFKVGDVCGVDIPAKIVEYLEKEVEGSK